MRPKIIHSKQPDGTDITVEFKEVPETAESPKEWDVIVNVVHHQTLRVFRPFDSQREAMTAYRDIVANLRAGRMPFDGVRFVPDEPSNTGTGGET